MCSNFGVYCKLSSHKVYHMMSWFTFCHLPQGCRKGSKKSRWHFSICVILATVVYKPQFEKRIRYKKEWRLGCMVVAAILIFSTPCGHPVCPPCWPMNAYEGQMQAEMVVVSTSLLPPFIGHIMFICLAKLYVPFCAWLDLLIDVLNGTAIRVCYGSQYLLFSNSEHKYHHTQHGLKVNRLTSSRSHASRNHQDRKPFPVVIAKYY